MKPLDFIIIGAQKSGTTSLFKYLKPHPKVYMPSDKEAPYFSSEDLFAAGWDSFATDYFSGADSDQFWGTASPQYMSNMDVPKRIYEQMPNAKLIAILRNPIERAYSHYSMQVRREIDKRDFDTALDESLQQERLDDARATMPVYEEGNTYEDESNHYLAWGEYGRILEEYTQLFPKEQLLVLYLDDLVEHPKDTFLAVTNFIGVGDEHVPENVGEVFHKGGMSQIIPESWRTAIKNNVVFKGFWGLVPERTKSTVRYWYDQKNVKKGNGNTGPSDDALQKLVAFYKEDVLKLNKIANRPVPWKQFIET